MGTGFSYGRTEKASHSTDIQTFEQDYEFLRKVGTHKIFLFLGEKKTLVSVQFFH